MPFELDGASAMAAIKENVALLPHEEEALKDASKPLSRTDLKDVFVEERAKEVEAAMEKAEQARLEDHLFAETQVIAADHGLTAAERTALMQVLKKSAERNARESMEKITVMAGAGNTTVNGELIEKIFQLQKEIFTEEASKALPKEKVEALLSDRKVLDSVHLILNSAQHASFLKTIGNRYEE